MKIRNRLLVYGLVTSIGIGVASCTSRNEKKFEEDSVKVEQEDNVSKIKEKRMDYGK